MTQDIIINYLTEHKEQFKKDLTNIYEKKSLLKEIMEKAFDKKIDIAREKYLKPLVKNKVLKEIRYV